MSLPHALLGLLAIEPRSGYVLTKAFGNEGIGRYAWSAGHTSVYPELIRLAEQGLVEVTGEGARGSRTYGITDTGRDELREWLVTPPIRVPKVRNEQLLRMFLLSALEPDDAIGVLRRVIEHFDGEAEELRRMRAEFGDAVLTGPAGWGQIAAEYGVRADAAARGWAVWAIKQFERIRADT